MHVLMSTLWCFCLCVYVTLMYGNTFLKPLCIHNKAGSYVEYNIISKSYFSSLYKICLFIIHVPPFQRRGVYCFNPVCPSALLSSLSIGKCFCHSFLGITDTWVFNVQLAYKVQTTVFNKYCAKSLFVARHPWKSLNSFKFVSDQRHDLFWTV